MTPRRIGYALFAAYVIATAVHIGFVMLCEPFAFDAWNVAIDTEAKPATVARFFEYWWFEYTSSNPRIGQVFSYLGYKLEYFAVIATPVAYLALTLAITILGLGRWPRQSRDIALWAIVIGFGWFAFPELGRNLFNRAYGANYVFSAAIQLWFLVPLRVCAHRQSSRAYFAYAIAGVIAGLCNEHTGPALILLLLWLAYRARKQADVAGGGNTAGGGTTAGLPWAGALGMIAGYAAIFFAPGQGERYEGIAERTGLVMRIIKRGVIGNLDIVRDYLVYAAPVVAIVVILLIVTRSSEPEARERRSEALSLFGIAIAVGAVITLTLFASPKLGGRFYIAPMALLLAGAIAMLDALARPRFVLVLVLLAVSSSAYAVNRSVPLYLRVAEQSAERMAALDRSKPGETIVVEAFEQIEESWWFIGDDFRVPHKRRLAARYFALSRVLLRGWDPTSPLGTTGVRVIGTTTIDGKATTGEIDLDETNAPNIGLVTARAKEAFDDAKRRGATAFEVTVEFTGPPPALPRSKIVVARAHDGTLVSHVGSIVRPGVTRLRNVVVPTALLGGTFEIHVVQVGSEVRKLDSALQYTPWKTGVYWALACDATECWLIAASRNHG